jgi:hypothetical protein
MGGFDAFLGYFPVTGSCLQSCSRNFSGVHPGSNIPITPETAPGAFRCVPKHISMNFEVLREHGNFPLVKVGVEGSNPSMA